MKKLSQITKLNELKDDGSYLTDFTQKTEVGKSFVALHKEMNATRAQLEKDRLNSNTTSVSTKEIDRSKDRMGYNNGEDLTKAFPKMAGPDDYRLNTTYDAYRVQDEETITEGVASLKDMADTHFARSTDHLVKAANATDYDAKHFHDSAAQHHKALHDLYNGAHKKCCAMAEDITPGHEGTTSEETEETMKPFKAFLDEASVTRKHFREVANTVRAVEDPAKRQELADHHSAIFKRANPNFSHEKFHEACGTHYRVS